MTDLETQLKELTRGCVDVTPADQLAKRLEEGKPLTVMAGFDPTAPDLHFGHTVVLNKLRQFQDYGHRVLVVIGGFTAMIGDPSGKNDTRPVLSARKVAEHATTYENQIFKVLDRDRTEVLNNADWLSKLTAADLIELASRITVSRMLEREDFKMRRIDHLPISVHEFIYPLLQAHDSVELKIDVEIGGTDQTFNLLLGREFQRYAGQRPQVVMTLPLLIGLDGVRKMSKSLGNAIPLNTDPKDMYGKLMSISDELMWDFWKYLSLETLQTIDGLRGSVTKGANPRDIKMQLAYELTARMHGKEAADAAQQYFWERFSLRKTPLDVTEVTMEVTRRGIPLYQALKKLGFADSSSESLRLIKQGAVYLDNERTTSSPVLTDRYNPTLIKVGKRGLIRLTLEVVESDEDDV